MDTQYRELRQPKATYFGTQNALASWGHVVSAMLSLFGSRGIWTMGPNAVFGANDTVIDISGNADHVQTTTAQQRGLSYSGVLAPVIDYGFNGRAQGIGVNANYNPIAANDLGVTCFCWAKLDYPNGTNDPTLIDKSTTANQYSYKLQVLNMAPVFTVSPNGVATVTVTGAVQTQAFYADWHFYCGRYGFNPNTLDVYHDNLKVTSGAPPATIFPGISPFYLGRRMSRAGNFNEQIALGFLTPGYLDDTEIYAFYELSRPLFYNDRPA